jgi:hypothetical protein
VLLITVTPTEGGVPNTDDDGRQREQCLHPRFRIDSNEANSSHIGHPSKPSGQIDHEQIEFTPEEDGKTRRQILACRGEIVCFELGAPKGTPHFQLNHIVVMRDYPRRLPVRSRQGG